MALPLFSRVSFEKSLNFAYLYQILPALMMNGSHQTNQEPAQTTCSLLQGFSSSNKKNIMMKLKHKDFYIITSDDMH